jgi:hypothetical protein
MTESWTPQGTSRSCFHVRIYSALYPTIKTERGEETFVKDSPVNQIEAPANPLQILAAYLKNTQVFEVVSFLLGVSDQNFVNIVAYAISAAHGTLVHSVCRILSDTVNWLTDWLTN